MERVMWGAATVRQGQVCVLIHVQRLRSDPDRGRPGRAVPWEQTDAGAPPVALLSAAAGADDAEGEQPR